MLRIEELAQTAQTLAPKLGITKYDIYGAIADSTSVEVQEGEPKQIEAANRSGVTIRVWNDQNTLGITSTTDTDPTGLELALKTALEASQFGPKEHIPDFSPLAQQPIAIPPTPDTYSAPVPELLTQLITAEQKILSAHPAIKGVPYNGLSQSQSDRFYLNSEGALRYQSNSSATIYLYSKTEQEGKKPRMAGAYRVALDLKTLDLEGCLTEAIDKTISHLDYKKIPTGKYPVVFSGKAFLSLLRGFSNLFNAQSILDKQSLSTPESIGTKISSGLLSLCDDPLNSHHIGPDLFDGEGTPTQRVQLIQNGILTNFLHSAGTAKRLNTQPTGNANIGAKVTISSNYYHVYQGEPTTNQYQIETADGVIWIDELHALHAGVQALQGSFSLPFDGWIIENGTKTSIDSATVAGDFRELLQSIIYVAPEPEITPSGICPKIWIDGLSITGE